MTTLCWQIKQLSVFLLPNQDDISSDDLAVARALAALIAAMSGMVSLTLGGALYRDDFLDWNSTLESCMQVRMPAHCPARIEAGMPHNSC